MIERADGSLEIRESPVYIPPRIPWERIRIPPGRVMCSRCLEIYNVADPHECPPPPYPGFT